MKKAALLTFLIVLVGSATSCTAPKLNRKKLADNYVSDTRADAGFKEIKAGNAVLLIISVQEEFGVTIEGAESLLKDVKTEVEGETLVISTKGNISPANKIRLKISMPELTGLELWGASEAVVTKVKSNSLKIQTGATSIVKIDGETKSLRAHANGSSMIDAEKLKAENVEAKTAGTSEITVFATNELTTQTLGASIIFYTGEPKNIRPDSAGTGETRKK
jgi:hypothetical protein